MNRLLGYLLFLILKILNFTYRYRYTNEAARDQAIKEGGNYVYALWHQNIIGCLLGQQGEKHVLVISPSSDGELIAIPAENLGHATARGSSSRGGRNAVARMIEMVSSGIPGAITVDGPQGPPFFPKKGIIEICKASGAMILPYASYPEKYWTFEKSWDKFRVPKPFTRIIIHYGKPIPVASDFPNEDFRKLSEKIKIEIENAQKAAFETLSDPQKLAQCKTTRKGHL